MFINADKTLLFLNNQACAVCYAKHAIYWQCVTETHFVHAAKSNMDILLLEYRFELVLCNINESLFVNKT